MKIVKFARKSSGEIIKDFSGHPFVWDAREDVDGFLRQILGLSFDEYTIHYIISRGNQDDALITEEHINDMVKMTASG